MGASLLPQERVEPPTAGQPAGNACVFERPHDLGDVARTDLAAEHGPRQPQRTQW